MFLIFFWLIEFMNIMFIKLFSGVADKIGSGIGGRKWSWKVAAIGSDSGRDKCREEKRAAGGERRAEVREDELEREWVKRWREKDVNQMRNNT